MKYSRDLKKELCEKICVNGDSTLKTANEYGIPIKTFEKWITAYNKDNHCFDPIIETITDIKLINNINNTIDYNDLSNAELKHELMKKDIEIERLKKNYSVKEGGMGQKVFITFSNKNMK
ncbi:hypothetical protein [uncultured Brachyspira sp.]|uniref:hypothetical protein n=1 Tax=uncultured Brachyspira sp. TaxID=221953 RepID=UPI00263846DA|nr:hypothetical protein [uncultured Brachyspira sp.]